MTTTGRTDARGPRTAIALLAGILPLLFATPTAAGAGEPTQPTFDPVPAPKSVAGSVVRGHGADGTGLPSAAVPHPPVEWPSTTAVTVKLDAASAATRKGQRGEPKDPMTAVPGLPVRLAQTVGTTPTTLRLTAEARRGSGGPSALDITLTPASRHVSKHTQIEVDYSKFAGTFGGDWADRLTLHTRAAEGSKGKLDDVRNDVGRRVVSARVALDGPMALVLEAAPSGAAGNYAATSLAATGTWQAELNSGDFAWTYGTRMPPTPGGVDPDLSLSYSSQSVDGRVVSRNNQPSWVGEGWDLWPGYIERSYMACADDAGGNNGTTKTGDLCWETDNATLSSGLASGRLIRGTAGAWTTAADGGLRIERRTGAANGVKDGEYWIVTSRDGTTYYFGLNRMPGWSAGNPTTNSAWGVPVFGNDSGEPCHATTFAASACLQAYRWNLDYVVDVHGNSMSYFYVQETNKYGQNAGRTTAEYTRGGYLAEVHYGMRSNANFADVPAKVVLTPEDRCVPGKDCTRHDAATWPDVPWDLECRSACTLAQSAPSFWSTKRLARMSTYVLKGNGTPQEVDRWDLTHTWPATGDSTTPSMWLNSIKRTGLGRATAVALEDVTFTGQMLPNRLNTAEDGLPALNKPRLSAIDTDSGGRVSVGYAPSDCIPGSPPLPETNANRCYPVRWTMPPATDPTDDWFHKYVVAEVRESDRLTAGTPTLTRYEYVGAAAWAWDPDPLQVAERRSWTDWRGYETVVVRTGDPDEGSDHPVMKQTAQFFRGMDGDRKSRTGGEKRYSVKDTAGTFMVDERQLAGFTRERVTYLGDTQTEVEGTITSPVSRKTASQTIGTVTFDAFAVQTADETTRTHLSTGGSRETKSLWTYDADGNVLNVSEQGDLNVSGDERCTTSTYAKNGAAHILGLVATTTVEARGCHVGGPSPVDVIAETRTYYDNHSLSASPTRGLPTKTEVRADDAATPRFAASTAEFDLYGRQVKETDVLGRATTYGFTQTGGLTTKQTVTNPLGHVETATVDPAWGLPTVNTDANGHVTTLGYDALGRLRSVYLPGRTVDDGRPDIAYAYGLKRSGGPNWISTEKLMPGGNSVVSYALYDGLLRPRQTQRPSPVGNGRVLTNVTYDSRGLAVRSDAAYYNEASPGTSYFQPAGGAVPGSTVSVFDGAGRQTVSLQLAGGKEKARTSTGYDGNAVTVVPPTGGTATTTWTDAMGRVTAIGQHLDASPEGRVETSNYTYTYSRAGQLEATIDAAGNKWTYGYDYLGRLISVDDPDAGVSNMVYDDAGQLTEATDARGRRVVHSYDALGRVLETSEVVDAGSVLLTKSVYDTLVGGKGQLTSATRFVDGQKIIRRTDALDAAGRPTKTSVVVPPLPGLEPLAGTYTTGYAYTPSGDLASTTLPKLGDLAAETISMTYTPLGGSNRVVGATTYVDATTYDEVGDVSSVLMGAKPMAGQPNQQLKRWSTYDAATRRLTQQQVTREVDGSSTAHNLEYQYDDAGNVLRVVDHSAGFVADTQCYRYDHLRRVTQAWTQVSGCVDAPSARDVAGPAPYWQTFTYDAAGNRKTKTDKGLNGGPDVTQTYNYTSPGPDAVRPHAVNSVNTPGANPASYSYDASGHTVTRPNADGPQTLEWDALGQLVRTSSAYGDTSYVYDAAGAMLILKDTEKATLFLEGDEVELDLATTTLTGRRNVAGVGTRTKAAGLAYIVTDANDTPLVAVSSRDVRDLDVRRATLFGEARPGTSRWLGGSRGFAGGVQVDANTTRLGAREYDAEIGSFSSVDPVIVHEDPTQWNGYAYAGANPTTMTDPSGMKYFIGDDVRRSTKPSGCDGVYNRCNSKSLSSRLHSGSTSWDSGAARARAATSCRADAVACGMRRAKDATRLAKIERYNRVVLPVIRRNAARESRFEHGSESYTPFSVSAVPSGIMARAGLSGISGAASLVPPFGLVGDVAGAIAIAGNFAKHAFTREWAAIGSDEAMVWIESRKSDTLLRKVSGTDDILELTVPEDDVLEGLGSYENWARKRASEGKPVWLLSRLSTDELSSPRLGWQERYTAMYKVFLDSGYTVGDGGNALYPPGG